MENRGSVRAEDPAASLVEISRVLEESARLLREHAEEPRKQPLSRDYSNPSAAQVRAIIAAGRLRGEFLGVDTNDGVWAMMLELYAARLEGRSVSQTRLGLAAGVAQTTALRLIARLVERGVFERTTDARDDRLVVLALSDSAAGRIRAYLVATQGTSSRLNRTYNKFE